MPPPLIDKPKRQNNVQAIVRVVVLILINAIVGAVCWAGATMSERITHLKADLEAQKQLRREDQAAYKIIDCSKAETVATCLANGGTDCDKKIQ